jgi:Outer membrane protein beta-barrel domain
MKAALITIFIFSFLSNLEAQNRDKKITKKPEGITPVYMEYGTVDGEAPDTLPPAPKNHFFIGAGPLVSQLSNTNISERHTVSTKTGFTVNAGYAFAFKKGRLLINTSYSESGVTVASGDINGDGHADKESQNLRYITIPVQYQHFLDKKKVFYFGGGGYAALLLPAIQKVRAYNEGFEKQDAGFMISAGVRMGRHFQVTANYQQGLMDVDASAANKAKNGMAFLTLSYSYGPVITIKPKG